MQCSADHKSRQQRSYSIIYSIRRRLVRILQRSRRNISRRKNSYLTKSTIVLELRDLQSGRLSQTTFSQLQQTINSMAPLAEHEGISSPEPSSLIDVPILLADHPNTQILQQPLDPNVRLLGHPIVIRSSSDPFEICISQVNRGDNHASSKSTTSTQLPRLIDTSSSSPSSDSDAEETNSALFDLLTPLETSITGETTELPRQQQPQCNEPFPHFFTSQTSRCSGERASISEHEHSILSTLQTESLARHTLSSEEYQRRRRAWYGVELSFERTPSDFLDEMEREDDLDYAKATTIEHGSPDEQSTGGTEQPSPLSEFLHYSPTLQEDEQMLYRYVKASNLSTNNPSTRSCSCPSMTRTTSTMTNTSTASSIHDDHQAYHVIARLQVVSHRGTLRQLGGRIVQVSSQHLPDSGIPPRSSSLFSSSTTISDRQSEIAHPPLLHSRRSNRTSLYLTIHTDIAEPDFTAQLREETMIRLNSVTEPFDFGLTEARRVRQSGLNPLRCHPPAAAPSHMPSQNQG